MALKKEDRVRLEGLEKTFTMLVTNGMDAETIKNMMQPQFDEFESITGSKVKAHFGDNASLEVLDLSKDFLRIRFPNEDNRVLRAKIQGVGVEVKLFKRDDFEFGNDDVVSALRALADEVSELPMPLNSLEMCDVRKLAKGDLSPLLDPLDDEGEQAGNVSDEESDVESQEEYEEDPDNVEDVLEEDADDTEEESAEEDDFGFLNGVNS